MANLIKNGALLLSQLLKQHASETVTYERVELGTVDVPATFGSKLLRTHDQLGGLRVEWTDLDFIIPAADLVIAGQSILEPLKGDFIYVTQGQNVQQYEVLPFGYDPPWRWSDPFLINFRIHTKLIAIQQAMGILYAGDSSSPTLDSDGVQLLATSRQASTPFTTVAIFGTNYKYIAYPDMMGDVETITDLDTGFPVAMAGTDEDASYNHSTTSGVPYAAVLVNATPYRVYRSQQVIGGLLNVEIA
jgi:hypothetical protein